MLRYNAALPTKFMPAPGYSAYVAPEKYAKLGWVVFGGRTEEDRRRRLFEQVDDAARRRGHAAHAEGRRCARGGLRGRAPDLALTAFDDPSMRTNPRMPLISEIVQLLRRAYGGGTGA